MILNKQCHIDIYQDVTPPTITVNKPMSGESVTGAFTISASAVDNRFSVASMSISVDSSSIWSVYRDSIYYTLSTEFLSDGWHTIDIYALDNVGNSGYTELSVYMTKSQLIPQQTIDQLALIIGLIAVIVIVVLAVVVVTKDITWEMNDSGRVPRDSEEEMPSIHLQERKLEQKRCSMKG